ncbi:MAG: C-terminal binding protein [bacterium]
MMKKPFIIAVTDYDYPSLDLEERAVKAAGGRLIAGHSKNEEDIIELAREADGLLNQYVPITERVFQALKNCEVVCRYGVGVDNVDLEAATRHGVVVCNVPFYCLHEVSNHALALILALTRKVVAANSQVKGRIWDFNRLKPVFGSEGRTVGIVGFGNIGRLLARKVKPLGYRCVAYDPYVEDKVFKEEGVERVNLETLLREADIISLHAALTKETYHLIGERELKMMKPTAFLVNTSRGKLIDQGALYRALRDNIIAGAGLDVLEEEPPRPDDPILSLDNVIFTPHLAFYSEESFVRLRTTAVESAIKVIKGEMPQSVVNKDVLKKIKLNTPL